VHTDFCYFVGTLHHIVMKNIVPCIMSILLMAYIVLVFTSYAYAKLQTGSDLFEY
jgi:hypothetical protein